ncbi:MAG TPA: pentapeptide repeat-containing protein [Micromonospora sp.]
MQSMKIGDVQIPTPNLDPHGLIRVTRAPTDELTEVRIADEVWPRTHFAEVSLSRSHVERVDLTESQWRDVALYGCRFEQVNLSGAILTGVTMERCHLINCQLTAVQLSDARLKNVILEGCRLDHATLVHVRVTGPVAVVACDLSYTLLVHNRMSHLVARSCRLVGLEVDDCDATGADVRGNDLSHISRGLLSLRGAVIEPCQVEQVARLATRELHLTVRGCTGYDNADGASSEWSWPRPQSTGGGGHRADQAE